METNELIRTLFIILTIFFFICTVLSHCISKQRKKQKKLKRKRNLDLFYKDLALKRKKNQESVIDNTYRKGRRKFSGYDELIDKSY